MSQDTLYILSTPAEPSCPATSNLIPARLSHRISPAGQLLRLNSPYPSTGSLLVVSCSEAPPLTASASLCSALLGECLRCRARGLFPDFEIPSPFARELICRLSPKLARLGITLFLPEPLAPLSPGCRVLLPCALSGGSLELRLREVVAQYSVDRVVLCLQPTAEDFPLPCPSGKGVPLPPSELASLLARNHPHPHFSASLCTHYFTYQTGSEIHLVLFDDETSLRRKKEVAHCCGISRFFLARQDLPAHPGPFLPSEIFSEIFQKNS